MKKIISLVIVLSMVLSCFCAVPAFAASSGTYSDTLAWSLDDEGTLTVSGTGDMPQWASYSKTPWYTYKDSVKKVVIGEGITSISEDSFWKYTSLTEVVISSTVTTIGSWAFSSCSALTEVTIPPTVTSIDFMAFYGVETIKGYTYSAAELYALEDGVTFVSLGVLPEAEVASGTCGEGVTWSLTNRNVLTVSGSGAIDSYDYEEAPWYPYFQRVQTVIIEDGITAIGDGAFNACIYITDLSIPDSVTSIGSMAFYGCWKLEELTLPSSLVTVGNDAFNSFAVTELVIPQGVTSIGDYAFWGEYLEKVNIPASVTTIGEEAFGVSENLVITGTKGSAAEDYASENGCEFVWTLTENITGTCGDNLNWMLDTEGNLTISGSGEMTSFGYTSTPWYDCADIVKNVVIETGVTSISAYAFTDCTSLASVTMPYTVESIGSLAFYNVPSDMVINGYIPSEAYNYANNMGYTFVSVGETPCVIVASGTCGDSVTWTYDNYNTLTLSGSGDMADFESYSSSYPQWNSYRSYIKKIIIEEGITSIGDYVFKDTSDVTEVIIPDSVTSIGKYAFRYCYDLESITIPLNVTSIGSSAFMGCSVLIKGYSPSLAEDYANDNSLTFESIGNAPLSIIASGTCGDNITWTLDNYGLMKIEGTGEMIYPEDSSSSGGEGVELMSVSSYDVPWVSYRNKIKKVEISDGVTSVADYAFYYCNKLSEVILPESVTSVGAYAFYECSSLKEITLSYNVMNIGNNAFNPNNNDFISYYGLVIKGYSGSIAEEYATKVSISFESLGDAPLMVFESGNLTDTITWTYYNNRTLVLSGSGAIPDYGYNPSLPWSSYKNSIESIEIGGGITYIGTYFIDRYANLTEITVGEGVKEINEYAFRYAEALTRIILPQSIEIISGNALPSNSEIVIAGYENTYAQSYAEKVGYVFESLGKPETEEVYVNSVEQLIDAIASNRTIIIEDGIYLLDDTYFSDEYPYEYIDQITIRNVSNLTIKARNAGMVEILAAQQDDSSTAPLVLENTYGVTIEGIRIGNMAVRANSGNWVWDDDVTLMGGYDDYGIYGFEGISVSTHSDSSSGSSVGYPIYLMNKVTFVNCDIFNSTYGISFYSGSLTVDGCTIRDNVRCGLYASYADVTVKDSVFSGNGSSDTYRTEYCLNVASCDSFAMDGCMFINNSNNSLIDGYEDNITNCTYSNNVSDGQSVKAFGVTSNLITWYVTEENGETVLKLGYSINADSMTIESALGTVYPYSVISAPWANFDIDRIDIADNVLYNDPVWGACGVNITWQLNRDDKTLVLSGGTLSRARTASEYSMSDITSYYIWGDYGNEIESIEISDNITGIYNNFEDTAYYRNMDNWENGALYIGDILVDVNGVEGEFVVREGTRIIADEAFSYLGNLTSVVLPEGVTFVGAVEKLGENEYAPTNGVFSNCSSLKSITIPVSVTQFDHAMVYNCNNLSDIYYSGTMAQWEEIIVGKRNEQLDYCNIHCSDGTIEAPDFEYTVYDDHVVIDKVVSKDAEIVIPKEIEGLPVTKVYYNAFINNTAVTSIIVEAQLESMFYLTGCTAVESITLPEGMYLSSYMISDTAFYKNEANWTDGYLYHNNCLVDMSDSIKGKVVIDNVKVIGEYVFSNKPYITEVVIADGITFAGGEFFYNCEQLESITLPDTFKTERWVNVDDECSNVKNIYISLDNPYYTSVDGVVYSKDKSTLVHMPVGRTGSYTIPDTTNAIGKWAFLYSPLSTLTIPASVTSIGESAFETCDITTVYYLGTQTQWENDVEIGSWNDQLTDIASIYFGETATPSVLAKKVDNAVVVELQGFDGMNGAVYITGVKNGVAVDVQECDGDGSYTLTGDIKYVKVFTWESVESMKPVIEPVIAEVE